ncbi:MAG: shikimate kinase [Acidimicrobiia bacterium]|jgi:shikimate kinase|nr:shikimate kinase [Acidimicrobiia bacterium]
MTGRHVMLIGMMGAGKTTVGAECARRLDRAFVDTDEIIEAAAGRTISEIFGSGGEEAFRAMERAAVADVCASPAPLVIAAGGGAMLDPVNRRLAGTSATVVWLRTGPRELAQRVAAQDIDTGSERPLLATADPIATIERLTSLRADAYAAIADVVVDTDDHSVGEVADAVLDELARCDA